jgi:hypothetical protein
VLTRFKTQQQHLALVLGVEEPDDGRDSFFTPRGIITLEDIIEEILQDEIVDETDTYRTLGAGKSANQGRRMFDMAQLRVLDTKLNADAGRGEQGNGLSAQEVKVIATHLLNNVEQFRDAWTAKQEFSAGGRAGFSTGGRPRTASATTDGGNDGPALADVERLVSISKVLRFEAEGAENDSSSRGRSGGSGSRTKASSRRLYVRGRCDNHCTLVLDGKVSLVIGSEGFRTKMGKFDIMAKPALTARGNDYVPEFTATADGSSSCRVLRLSCVDFRREVLGMCDTPTARAKKKRDKSRDRDRDRSRSADPKSRRDVAKILLNPPATETGQAADSLTENGKE